MNRLYRSEQGALRAEAAYRALLARWPVPARHFHVPTRHGDTFIVACGNPGAPPLMLLHGSGGNSAMWLDEVAIWAPHFELFAIDVIGEPGLSAPTRLALASEGHAQWLDDVVAALKLAHVSLIGASLGGWLALDYATRRPTRVERLVLLVPGGIGRQRAGFLWKMIPLALLGAWGRRTALQLTLGATPTRPTAAYLAYREFLSLVQQVFHRRMEALPIFTDAALAQLEIPLLALLGARDIVLDSGETQQRLERRVSGARVVRLEAAGHGIFGQGGTILDFLRSAEPARSIVRTAGAPA